MASCITSQWAGASPQIKLTVEEDSSTGGSVTLSWKIEYVTSGYAASVSDKRAYKAKINGSVVKSGTYDIDEKSGPAYTIASGKETIDKTDSAQSISFSVSMDFNMHWSGVYAGTQSASGSISISAKTSYTVSYDANGGSGAPSSQTKWYGDNITLSSTKPTRTGYSFGSWNTNSNGTGTNYSSGETYTSNKSVTLYAKWNINTYSVKYNANGGTGAPSSQTKTYGTTLKLSSTKPTRTNYNFKGWATSSSSTIVSYASGANYTSNSAITLYAVWELIYTKPAIKNVKAVRYSDISCTTQDELGIYCKVTFDWSCDQNAGLNNVRSITVNNQSVIASGISGTSSKILNGTFSIEQSYAIIILVTDERGGTTQETKTLPSSKFPIDFLAGGNGVAFGKVANESNLFDVNFPTLFRDRIDVTGGNLSIFTHTSSQKKLGIGVGLGGTNRGVYDATNDRWIIYVDDQHLYLVPPETGSSYKPYFCAGDSITLEYRTAGYFASGSNSTYVLHFGISLPKPILGDLTVTYASTNGFRLYQNNHYTSSYVKPSSYTSQSTNSGLALALSATFNSKPNADFITAEPMGIYWNGTISFT